MEDINLHFTGDIHAVSAAHNLLAAALDNYIHHGNVRRIDHRRIVWNRVLDINDRALRDIVIGLGEPPTPFRANRDSTVAVASEVMAILCLSDRGLNSRSGLAGSSSPRPAPARPFALRT